MTIAGATTDRRGFLAALLAAPLALVRGSRWRWRAPRVPVPRWASAAGLVCEPTFKPVTLVAEELQGHVVATVHRVVDAPSPSPESSTMTAPRGEPDASPRILAIPLPGNRVVEMKVPAGGMTRDDFKVVIATLKLWKKAVAGEASS